MQLIPTFESKGFSSGALDSWLKMKTVFVRYPDLIERRFQLSEFSTLEHPMKPTLNLIAGTAWAVLAGLIVLAFTNTAVAEGESETERLERLERVEEKVDALTDEVGRLESIFAVPEELESM